MEQSNHISSTIIKFPLEANKMHNLAKQLPKQCAQKLHKLCFGNCYIGYNIMWMNIVQFIFHSLSQLDIFIIQFFGYN